MVNRPAAPTASQSAANESEVLKQKKANETQQAVVLFIIVLVSHPFFGEVLGHGSIRHSRPGARHPFLTTKLEDSIQD